MTKGQVEDAGGRLSAATVAAYERFGRSSGTREVGGREVAWEAADGGIEVTHLPADSGGPPHVYVVGVAEGDTPGGGSRSWWLCPGYSRRAGDLFLVAGSDRLGCRTCCGLAYASQLTRERGRAKPARERVMVETETRRWSPATGWVRTRTRRRP
jgi:hypothetical protein